MGDWVVNSEFTCCPVHHDQGIDTPIMLDPEKPNMVFCEKGCEMTLDKLGELLNG